MTAGRVAGIGVLAGAVLLLAVVAGRQPLATPGTAVAAAVPGAPTVGQCLVARIGSEALLTDDAGLRSSARDVRACALGADSLSPVVLVGEVAAVLVERSGRPHDACATPVADFLGVGDAPVADSTWSTAGGPLVLVVNPDRRQWADGQRWQSCVVAAPMWTEDGRFDPTRGIGATRFESVRGGWSDPTFRDRLGDCFDEYIGAIARLLSPAWCGTGHEVERVGLISDGLDSRSAALLRQSCADLAATRTAATDPTRGGMLRVEVDVTAPGRSTRELRNDDEEIPADATADCLIRPSDPTALLGATVIGLGDGPVPLVPR